MINSGAKTPPEVPEPSATAQITALTTSSSSAARGTVAPCSMRAMLS